MNMPYSSSVSPACRSRLATAHTSTIGPAERRREVVAEQDDARDRVRRLEVRQVVRDPERIERPLAHLVEAQVVALLRIGVLGQAEDLHRRRARPCSRRSPPSSRPRRRRRATGAPWIEPSNGAPRDMPRAQHLEAGRVGDDRLLEADLRAVRERRHHRGVLTPLLGPRPAASPGCGTGSCSPLTLPITRGIEPRPLTQRYEVHLQPRLVPVAGRQDRRRAAGRTRWRIGPIVASTSAFMSDDVLAVLERLECDLRAELDRAGDVDDDIDLLRATRRTRRR